MRNSFGVFSGILLLASTLTAAQIGLNESNVIGASGSYWNTGWNEYQFGAQNVLSQQTGSIHENWGDASYWINPDNGPANAYIVIDLGAEYQIDSITLFNTHNGWANDRGTGNFQIEAGNSIGPPTGNGYDITGPLATILTGTLQADSNNNYYLTPQGFAVSATGYYRYLRFEPLSVAVSGNPYALNVYGLNEIRVFGTEYSVPEPATWLTALPLLALLLRRRAR